ncbi:hypothetical protein MRX96_033552 [Rhipicephalus microplus]
MKRRCRRRREKKEANANVGFLNIHGGRKRSKWEELYQMLETEKMTLYAVAETHLLGLEERPVRPNWQWAGNNREPGSRKGGGIGVLWCNGIESNWKKLEGSCLGMPVLVAVLYFSVDPRANF